MISAARVTMVEETGPPGCTVDEIAEIVSLSKRTIERRYMKKVEAGKIAAMSEQHSKATILSMAIITAGLAALLHEGLGHGVTAWLRGDIPTQLTSNHLSTLRADRWVDAAGTLVNLAAGALSLLAARAAGARASLRYFCWLLASHNLLPGAGYFLFSGVIGFGDWEEVIRGLPHQAAWRIGMSLFGAALYVLVARLLAVGIWPFCPQRSTYNTVGRVPYLAACLFSCVAGAFDPLGLKLLLVSTVPAAFGGSSGMLWLDSLMPRSEPAHLLMVRRHPVWWIVAIVFAAAYIGIIGRGINRAH